MQTDVAALAVTFADRGSSHDDDNAEPPDTQTEQPAERPPRRRWFDRLLGGAFLDGPNSTRWQGACGQGG